MKIKRLDEVTKEHEKKKVDAKSKETYGLEFAPSKKTLNAMKEADDIISGKKDIKGYSSFKEMWDDLIGD